VSAESGIPTFREAQTGLWARNRPEDLASPRAWRQDPERVWQWYAWRYRLCAEAKANPGHEAIAALERLEGKGVTLVTQNVDGLHRQAGSPNPIELHGNLARARCEHCGKRFPLPNASEFTPPAECPKCGRPARPDVVWFGEQLEPATLQRAWRAFMEADLAIVAGTSSLVYPAADLPMTTRSRGGKVIEVNPDETPLTPYADLSLRGKAATLLPAIIDASRSP
jgi:NAD-dependent deacetylase